MKQIFALMILLFIACSLNIVSNLQAANSPGFSQEGHFKSIKQLTFEGTNAEAYFSPDGKKLVFQSKRPPFKCDQIYTMDLDGSNQKRVSILGGRNTCSFFVSLTEMIFSSTYFQGVECPPERDRSKGYVWEIFKSYDIVATQKDNNSKVKFLTKVDGYDAESTVCGNKIVFTSAREKGRLNIYTMDKDGSNLKQLTFGEGYKGGPFFSQDCKKIVFRGYTPTSKEERLHFKSSIQEGYIPKSPLEIFTMDSTGKNIEQITNFQAVSFAPTFYPDGNKVLISANIPKHLRVDRKRVERATRATRTLGVGEKVSGANVDATKSDVNATNYNEPHTFHLWEIQSNSSKQTQAQQISFEGTFNGFPMFSPDGKKLVFASNRNSKNPHDLHIFLAEWQ